MTTEQLCLTAAILFFCVALWMFLQREEARRMAKEWEETSNDWKRLYNQNGEILKRSMANTEQANATTQEALNTADGWKRMYYDLKGTSIELPLGIATEENPDYKQN